MKEMAPGLYEWEGDGEMPCLAANLRGKVGQYAAPDTLGRAEDEESAARILWPSISHGEWFGVSWRYLLEQMGHEHKQSHAATTARMNNIEEEFRAREARKEYCFFCVVTLGFYALFAEWPMPRLVEVPKEDEVFSVVPLYGPQAIVDGIRSLLLQGLVQVKKEEDTDEILFPTPKLIEMIMQAA